MLHLIWPFSPDGCWRAGKLIPSPSAWAWRGITHTHLTAMCRVSIVSKGFSASVYIKWNEFSPFSKETLRFLCYSVRKWHDILLFQVQIFTVLASALAQLQEMLKFWKRIYKQIAPLLKNVTNLEADINFFCFRFTKWQEMFFFWEQIIRFLALTIQFLS